MTPPLASVAVITILQPALAYSVPAVAQVPRKPPRRNVARAGRQRPRHQLLRCPRSVLPTPHKGIDFTAAKGTPVHATASGTVIAAGPIAENHGRYGNTVIIDHGGRQSLYAHLSSVSVTPASVCGRTASAPPARPASPPARTCTSKCGRTAIRRSRIHVHQPGCLRHATRCTAASNRQQKG
jgi:hypothetical protein